VVLLLVPGCDWGAGPDEPAQEPTEEVAAEAGDSSPPEDSVQCASGYRAGFVSSSAATWRNQWMYLVHHNGKPATMDMAVNLVNSIGKLARDDRQCRPLGKFTAHLEKIENQTSAGKRIPMADILETAVAGDVWLTAIDEAPVFVEGAVDAAK
jgi:hypothetical protein